MSTLIVSDPGSNWRASPDESYANAWQRARRLIGHAAQAGADVFKAQYFIADTLYERDTPAWRLVKPYELPLDWLPRLKEECDNAGIEFACTTYTPEHVALVDPLVKRHKISSYEAEHDALITAAAKTRKPLLVSMGTVAPKGGELWDVQHLEDATEHIAKIAYPHCSVTFLLCVSAYPALLKDQQLAILRHQLDYRGGYIAGVYGFSDHTVASSAVAAVVAVALGASVIETHMRTEERTESPDCTDNARDPVELAAYVESIRQAEEALGEGVPVLGKDARYKWNPATGKRGQ